MYGDFKRNTLTYGLLPHADINARNLRFSPGGSISEVYIGKTLAGELRLQVIGHHNVKNALAALGVALELDVSFDAARNALESFTGVRRRFELKGSVNGIDIYDDFAHHPTELNAIIKAIRNSFKRRLVVIFQPHLYSRTQSFYKQFGAVLMEADKVIVTNIYPSREKPIPGIDGKMIADALIGLGHTDFKYIPNMDEIPRILAGELLEGDIVITVGAGNIARVGTALLEALRSDG
jgi:UDP-N-acetylmuramate--alanine ligase